MDEICVAKFDVYECRKSDRASALSGAQLIICAAQTPEFPDTIPTISYVSQARNVTPVVEEMLTRTTRSEIGLETEVRSVMRACYNDGMV